MSITLAEITNQGKLQVISTSEVMSAQVRYWKLWRFSMACTVKILALHGRLSPDLVKSQIYQNSIVCRANRQDYF
ncbi:unnamed protein product [Blepharisma stoltei]|uniref:Uncharacterized protein n=1 Tax=Blepharisma stoltei TaxID=1481888 RepID=A0AAU9IGD0_9CILI|nr:unnamed protein product [Blepharisma stoltei]